MPSPLAIRISAAGRSLASVSLLVALSFLLGCAPDSKEAAGTAGPVFALDSIPSVDIGDEADGPQSVFSGLVIPALLSDGSIVVANGGSQELRFFDATGTWMHSAGGAGSGPGEFVTLGWLQVGTADTLLTYDWGQLRVSVFSSDGKFQRGYRLGNFGGILRPQTALANGAIIASRESIVDMNTAPGVQRDTAQLLLFDAEGQLLDSLGRFLSSEGWIDRTATGLSARSRPFGKRLTVRAHGNSVYVGSADTHELTVLANNGRDRRTLQWSGPTVPITPQIVDAYIAATVADAPAERRAALAETLRGAPFPATMPAYATFVVADDGRLWVGRYLARGQGERQTFDVMDSAGVRLGSVEMPPRFTPAQVTRDRVIGIWRDEDDVVHIRVYRLVRES